MVAALRSWHRRSKPLDTRRPVRPEPVAVRWLDSAWLQPRCVLRCRDTAHRSRDGRHVRLLRPADVRGGGQLAAVLSPAIAPGGRAAAIHRQRIRLLRTLGPPLWPGADILSRALGWPDGRLLNGRPHNHALAWFRLHHIQIWLTYQPGGRFLLFEYIELGWLVALSAILISATFILIRRRAA